MECPRNEQKRPEAATPILFIPWTFCSMNLFRSFLCFSFSPLLIIRGRAIGFDTIGFDTIRFDTLRFDNLGSASRSSASQKNAATGGTFESRRVCQKAIKQQSKILPTHVWCIMHELVNGWRMRQSILANAPVHFIKCACLFLRMFYFFQGCYHPKTTKTG